MANWWDSAPLADGGTATAAPAKSPYADAIASIESAGSGNYRAVGPATRTGDRAFGRYQIMGQNIRPWSKEVLGREVTPQEFMANPQLQDQIFNGKFGQYVDKYGPEGAARAWFAGEKGMNDPNRRDVLGTSVAQYGAKFSKAAGVPTDVSAQARQPVAGGNDWWQSAPLAEEPSATPGQTGLRRVVIDTGKIGQQSTAPAGDGTQDRGALDAAARGAAQGLTANFGDELRGLVEASGANPNDPASLSALLSGALRYWMGDQTAKQRYDEAAARERAANKEAETQHPVASTVGNIAGALALPIGAAGSATTLAGRLAAGAGVGAGYGAAAGAGEGQGLADTVSKAGTGAAVGGVLGGAAVPAMAALSAAGRGVQKLAEPITNAVRGGANPEAQAARNIALARARDEAAGNPGLTAAQAEALRQQGAPIINADVGGETVRALGRSAANTSAEGRNALNEVISDRYATQQPRIADFLKREFDFPDSTATIDRLHEAARRANRPAYNRAYAEGQSIWDDGLEQYVQAPVVQKAIQLAFVTGRNRAAMDGFPPIKNPFVMNRETGVLELKPGVTPNLQFWDHVKRNLDQMGAEGQAFSKALRNHLDEIVPSYAEARAGAAKFFGAEDALEAGAKFATMSGTDALKLGEARKALSKFTDAERKLFQTGFVSNLLAKVESLRDGQDVVKNIFNSEHARNQIRLALGNDKASKLEAQLLVERAMDAFRPAIQGNSSTARQLYELGLAGAKNPVTLATAVGGISSYGSGGVGPGDALAAGLTFAARKGQIKIDERVAKRVAEMLASDNPNILKAATRMVERTPVLRQLFRKLEIPVARGSASQAPITPAIQSASVSRADDQPDVPRPPGQ